MGYPIFHSQYTAAQIEASIGKGPRVNSEGYWEVWNIANGAYESTGVGAGVTPPTVVTQVSQMVNHGYVYIYNGNEAGYTPGYWYYWNGSAWTAGGAYQVAATDPTLSVAGAAADAKAAGSALNVDKAMLGIVRFWCNDKSIDATAASPAVSNAGNLYTINGSRTNTTPIYLDFSDLSRKTDAAGPAAYVELKAGRIYVLKYDPITTPSNNGVYVSLRDKTPGSSYVIASANEGEEKLISVNSDVSASFYLRIPGSTTYANYQFRVWLLDVTDYCVPAKIEDAKGTVYKTLESISGFVAYWADSPTYFRLSRYSTDYVQKFNRVQINGTVQLTHYVALSAGETRVAATKSDLSRTLEIKAGHVYRIITRVYSDDEADLAVKLYDGTSDLITFHINTASEGEFVAEEDATAVLCVGVGQGYEFTDFEIEVDLLDLTGEDTYWAGKSVAWYGDSLSYGSILANRFNAFPYRVAKSLGMTIYNHAIGGSVIAKQTKAEAEEAGAGYYDEIVFSLDEWESMEKDVSKSYLVLDDPTQSHPYRIYTYTGGEWTPTASYTSQPNGRYPIVDVVRSAEPDANLIVIALGFNDFMYHWTPFGTMADRGKNTFYGALHTVCNYLLSNHGDKDFCFVLVTSSRYQLASSINADWNCTTPDSVNPIGKTIGDYRAAVKEVCAYYSIPCLELGAEVGFAQWQHPSMYYFSDNLHWNARGHKRAAATLLPKLINMRGVVK